MHSNRRQKLPLSFTYRDRGDLSHHGELRYAISFLRDAHGHLCPRLDDPRSPDQIKKLIVYVKMDRCATDAVAHLTGARLGRRAMKFVDYGIMAASFVNLETGEARMRFALTEWRY